MNDEEMADRIRSVQLNLEAVERRVSRQFEDLESRINQEESDRERAITSLDDRLSRKEAGY